LNAIGFLPLWDSVNYAMATISTGGIAMSRYAPLSCSWQVKTILSLGMVMGSTTLVLFVNVLRGNWRSLIDDDQVRGMMKMLFFMLLVVVLWHWEKPFIDSLFMTVSAASGAGFPGSPSFHVGAFFWLATLIGGCSGSASGGIKIFRLQIMYRVAKNNLLRCLYPLGFYPTLYHNQPLDAGVIEGVMAAVFFYIAGLFVCTVALTLCGYVVVDAVTLASGALTNSGLPLGTWADHTLSFSFATKWVVMLTMLFGRLEFVTVLGLFLGLFRR
jgi:trk system potassium uptake protein TrkH